MSNIDTAKKFFQSVESGDIKTLESILADDFVFDHKGAPQKMNKKQFIQTIKAIHQAIPDWKFNNQNWQEGNPIRVTANITGSHKNTLDLSHMQMPVVPATQKKIKLPAEPCTLDIQGGKVRHHGVEAVPGGGISGIYSQVGVKLPAQQTRTHI